MSYYAYKEKDTEGLDSALMVRFWLEPKPDPEATLHEGRPIYRDVEYLEIASPGDRNNVVQRPMEDEDRQRFERIYESWKKGLSTDGVSGTLLTHVAWISRAQVEELAHFKIRTVENLAGMSDAALTNMGPAVAAWRQRAREMLDDAKKSAPTDELRKQMVMKDAEIETLKQQMADILAELKKKKV